jgi:MOSC domain-containing protein YiiM
MNMSDGILISIHIAPAARVPMQSVAGVRALPGVGLEGDRYSNGIGTFSKSRSPDREVTLIEIEALEALALDYGLELKPEESRRNLVTRGVALNHLVGREFKVGEVTLRGIRLCEPCDHLEGLVQKKIRPGLVHRGGLRSQILTGGTIRAGDRIEPQ